ncbi:hypothetical protein GOV05_05860 [Candidatus Woesearchaeota archaeon]|nr:hypothetical protein [Candidatus Woesearchaeota archaeon]
MNKNKKILLIILITTLTFLSACNEVSFKDEEANIICIPVNNISSFCKAQHQKVLSQAALNQTLIEEAADFVINEGDLLILDTKAIDPDGDMVSYNFTQPFDSSGAWQTIEGDAGFYVATIFASDELSITTLNVTIYVKKVNHAPIIGIESPAVFKEGEKMILEPLISDEDGDDVVYSVGGWDFGKTYNLGYDVAGEYEVVIIANDGKTKVSKTIQAIIEDVNRPPVLEDLADLEVMEGQRIVVTPVFYDPDGDDVTAEYSEPINSLGEWLTKKGDADSYDAKVTVSDGEDSVTKSFALVVLPSNRAPILEVVEDVVVEETENVKFMPIAYDPEGDRVSTSYSGWMTEDEYETTYDDSGEYIVTITVSDGELETFQHVQVTVLNKNRPPVFVK